jgi:hypothetical protein
MNMSLRSKTLCIAMGAGLAVQAAFGQCDKKTGFARQKCEAEAAATANAFTGANNSVLDALKSAPLTTSLTDAIHLETLPPSVDPKEFAPLLKLERADNGAFILKTGFYEAVLESYTLAFYDDHALRGSAFFPAPIKGGRAKIIADILKIEALLQRA